MTRGKRRVVRGGPDGPTRSWRVNGYLMDTHHYITNSQEQNKCKWGHEGRKPAFPSVPCLLKRPGSIPELNISCKRQHCNHQSKKPRGGQSGWQMESSPLYLGNARRCGWGAGMPPQTWREPWAEADLWAGGPSLLHYLHCLEHINSKKI